MTIHRVANGVRDGHRITPLMEQFSEQKAPSLPDRLILAR